MEQDLISTKHHLRSSKLDLQLEKSTTQNVSSYPSKHLTELESIITNSTPRQILDKIAREEWTSVQVTKSFIKAAKIAHFLTNCLSEVFFQEAIDQASELDEYQRKHKATKGKLHGLPISLKDEYNIEGVQTTIGLISRLDSPLQQNDSPIVAILRDQGAVLYCKTNVPTGVFNTTTFNDIFGSTQNPLNTSLNAGGSSGGEAALVALHGSPLGVGSDLGGSVRQPASFTGIFGFKPSSGRFPHDSTTILRGLESLNATCGVLCNSIDGLELFCQAVLQTKPWLADSRVLPVEWKYDYELPRKLRFGILHDDGVIRPTSPVQRALSEIRDVLEKNGIETVEWDANHFKISEISRFADIFMNSNGLKGLQNDKNITTNDLRVSELWELQYDRYLKSNEFLQYFNDLKIDALIAPVAPIAGCLKDEFIDTGYSPFPNVLNITSGVIPVTKVDSKVDHKLSFEYRNETEQFVHESFNANNIEGSGVGLQIVGGKFEEEKIIRIMQLISNLINT